MNAPADRHTRAADRRRLPPAARWAIAVVAVALLAVLGYGAWLANAVRSDLVAAQDRARVVQAALGAGQRDRAQDFLAEVVELSESARERTENPLWRVGEQMPFLGDDLTAVSEVVAAIVDLARDGAVPLLESTDGLTPDTLVPVDGQIPLKPLRDLEEPVAAVAPAFEAAADRVEAIDTDGLLGPVRSQLMRLEDELVPLARGVVSASRALPLLPGMLGAGEERDYLLLFQNNAEARASGGIPGATAIVTADEGGLSLGRQVAGSSFGRQPAPVLPLTDAERTLYDLQLGTFFQDINFTPHFPRTAELAQAFWATRYDEELDGVISVDPVALSYLLRGAGAVTLSDGRRINADNVVDFLLHEVYLEIDEPAAQDEFFNEVAARVFAKLTSGVDDPQTFLSGLSRGADEGRLMVHSFDDGEQDQIDGTQVAGELVADPDSDTPHVEVSVNDATASKMSYFLDYRASVTAESCADGVQELAGRAVFRSITPYDLSGIPPYVFGPNNDSPGSQLLLVRLHAPVGGSIGEVRFDGRVVEGGAEAVEYGRPARVLNVFLDPQQEIEVTWTMKTGPGQTGDVEVGVTPGVQPNRKSSTAASACG